MVILKTVRTERISLLCYCSIFKDRPCMYGGFYGTLWGILLGFWQPVQGARKSVKGVIQNFSLWFACNFRALICLKGTFYGLTLNIFIFQQLKKGSFNALKNPPIVYACILHGRQAIKTRFSPPEFSNAIFVKKRSFAGLCFISSTTYTISFYGPHVLL